MPKTRRSIASVNLTLGISSASNGQQDAERLVWLSLGIDTDENLLTVRTPLHWRDVWLSRMLLILLVAGFSSLEQRNSYAPF
jgi:hypothetical protein